MNIDYQVRYLSFYIIITLTTFIVLTATHHSTIMQASKKKQHYDLKGRRSHCEHKPCQEPNSRQSTTCLLSAVCKRKGSSSPKELNRQKNTPFTILASVFKCFIYSILLNIDYLFFIPFRMMHWNLLWLWWKAKWMLSETALTEWQNCCSSFLSFPLSHAVFLKRLTGNCRLLSQLN